MWWLWFGMYCQEYIPLALSPQNGVCLVAARWSCGNECCCDRSWFNYSWKIIHRHGILLIFQLEELKCSVLFLNAWVQNLCMRWNSHYGSVFSFLELGLSYNISRVCTTPWKMFFCPSKLKLSWVEIECVGSWEDLNNASTQRYKIFLFFSSENKGSEAINSKSSQKESTTQPALLKVRCLLTNIYFR